MTDPIEILQCTAIQAEDDKEPERHAALHLAAEVLTDYQEDRGIHWIEVSDEDRAALVGLLATFDETRRNHETRFPQALAIVTQARALLGLDNPKDPLAKPKDPWL